MIKAVVFDLDGTLLNTIQDLANAANPALRTLGLPEHTTEEFLHFVGDGRRNMVLRMLPEALRADEAMVARASGLFDEHYNAHLRDCTAPYPGIPELLAALKAKGLRLGVVSNKPHEFVTQIIEGYFPGLFDSVAGQQGGCIKPDPSGVKQVIDAFGLHPDQVLYVGDSAVDIETAQNAGTASCGVLWGFRDEAELEEAGAQYIAAHPQDIATLIASRNRAEGFNRGLALFTVAVMAVCLVGVFYFLFTGNGAGIGACVVLPLLMGFAATSMLKKKKE